jgi:hypothetical protein
MKVYERIITRYDGLFDLDGLYAAIIDWCKNYGFRWHEKDYKHKKGGEVEWAWEMTKKVTRYVTYKYTLTIHMWDMKEVPVEGKSKPLTNARLYIWIDSEIGTDWQNRESKLGRFGGWLGKIYDKRVFSGELADHYDIVWYKAYDLQSVIKKYFDMETKKNEYAGYL